MPLYHKPKTFTPLLIAAERKAVKNGLHHSIFTSRFDKYKGDWKSDKKEGKGYFQTITGKLYEGDWYKGFRHGFGTLSHRLPNGTYSLEYRGEWVRGKPEGIGWKYYGNGDVYFGFWKRGKRHGYGKMWYKNGTFYVGYWNENQREGLGMFVQGNGSKQVSLPVHKKKGNVKTMTLYVKQHRQENGNRYEGHWENSVKHGLGRFYHMHTGQLQEGCWLQDYCVKSKMSDILIRQFCDLPTPHPVPLETLQDSRKLLEEHKLWLQLRLGDIDKQLQFCIDKFNY